MIPTPKLPLKRLILLLSLLWPLFISANPLPGDKAFQLRAHATTRHQLVFQWKIANGYHLYQDSIRVTEQSGKAVQIKLPKTTSHFQHRASYQHRLRIEVNEGPYTELTVHYQGCQGATLCYPPMHKRFVVFKHHGTLSIKPWQHTQPGWLLLLSSFGIGLLLALTPCVLPMIPIVASLIIGDRPPSKWRGFTLTLSYVIAMAITYAIAGLVAAWLGYTLQSQLQTLWFSGLFAAVCVLMGGQLLSWYHLSWTDTLQRLGHRLSPSSRGDYWRAIILGCTTILVVSPCVSAPMVGLLTFISTQQQPWLGGLALFCTGLGMGVPMIIMNTVGQRLLPRQGRWMLWIKEILGLSLLVLALWLLSSHLSVIWVAVLSLILCAIWVWKHFSSTKNKSWRITLLIGFIIAVIGSGHLITQQNKKPLRVVQSIHTLSGLQHALTQNHHQPLIINFTANWCVACTRVHHQLNRLRRLDPTFLILTVDISQSNADTRLLQSHYQVFAPPTLILFDDTHHPFKRYDGAPSFNTLLNAVQQLKQMKNDHG